MRIFGIIIFTLLSACGGGSGGSGGSKTSENNSSSSSLTNSSASNPVTSITAESAPLLAGALLDTLSLASQPPQLSPSYELKDGIQKGVCDNNASSYTINISNNGQKIEENYQNCHTLVIYSDNTGEYLTYSGKQIQTYSKSGNQDVIQYSWDQFSLLDESSEKETISGSAEFRGFGNSTSFKINASIENSLQGVLNVNNFFVELTDKFTNFSAIKTLTGTINLINLATANLMYSPDDEALTLLGLNSSLKIYEVNENLNLDLDSNNDGIIDAALSINKNIADNLSEIALRKNIAPMVVNGNSYVRLNSLKLNPFTLKDKFTHPAGHLLKINIEFIEGNESDIQRIDATSFALKKPISEPYVTYRFYAYAVDVFGNQSQKVDMSLHVSADTDEDGNFDIYDSDDDNDGVEDRVDAFPLDATESKDTDEDGIGDNKDPDIDNDNIANELDAYPLDKNCSSPEEGDGKYCFQSIMSPKVLFTDKDGIFYLRSLSKIVNGDHDGMHGIIKWDSTQQKTIEVVDEIIPNESLNGIYAANSHLYFFHYQGSKTIYAYNPSTNEVTHYFDNQNEILGFTFDKGILILLTLNANSEIFYESYNSDGTLLSKVNWLVDINNVPTSISFRNSDLIPFCKISLSIDSDGQFIEIGDRADRWQDPCNNGYDKSISLDGNFAVLTGFEYYNGDAGIYNKSGELLTPAYWGLGFQSAWSNLGFTFADYADGHFNLNVITPYGEKLFSQALPDRNYEPHIYFSNGKIVVFSYQETGGIRIGVYDHELKPIGK